MRHATCMLITTLLLFTTGAIADTEIGDGRLYTCADGEILRTKDGKSVSTKSAVKKFRRIIKKKRAALKRSKKGSKKRKRLKAQLSSAKQGLRDAKSCAKGILAPKLSGDWNLLTENGQTPEEAGFISLSLSISFTEFVSTFVSEFASCSWMGPYESSSEELTIEISSSTGAPCDQAVGQERTAVYTLSDDGNTLTLDYTAEDGGALQVYERLG